MWFLHYIQAVITEVKAPVIQQGMRFFKILFYSLFMSLSNYSWIKSMYPIYLLFKSSVDPEANLQIFPPNSNAGGRGYQTLTGPSGIITSHSL